MIAYRAMLDVSADLVRYLTRLLEAERARRGTPARSRKLTCRDQAVMALRWFRDRTRIERLGDDNGISRATAYRYVDEAVDVLSAQAPDLDEALERVMAEGAAYVILDGKVFTCDRLAEKVTSVKGKEIHAWYSGKARRSGANVQAVMRPDGLPVWTGPALPGSVVDLTAARGNVLGALYLAACEGLPVLADAGYQGAGIGILTPVKNQPKSNQELHVDTRTYNALLRSLRYAGERGFALLTGRWAALQRITASPRRATEIIRAALVLTHWEHKYIPGIL